MDVAFKMVDGDERLVRDRRQAIWRRVIPTRRAPASPGPSVTATASRSCEGDDTGLAAIAARTTGTIFRRCSREAISGTTPPWRACRATCELMLLDSVCTPARITAAAVSSQLDSIPRMRPVRGAMVLMGLSYGNERGCIARTWDGRRVGACVGLCKNSTICSNPGALPHVVDRGSSADSAKLACTAAVKTIYATSAYAGQCCRKSCAGPRAPFRV